MFRPHEDGGVAVADAMVADMNDEPASQFWSEPSVMVDKASDADEIVAPRCASACAGHAICSIAATAAPLRLRYPGWVTAGRATFAGAAGAPLKQQAQKLGNNFMLSPIHS